MDLQSKLENIFRNLIEKDSRFGNDNKFISLSVNNLDGSEASDDNSGKIYLGVLKFYDVVSNVFKSVNLFVKIQPKGKTNTECGDEMIRYDFKFHNEYVAYKHILPFLNEPFASQIEEPVSPFNKVGSKRFSLNEDKENAYTIEEFKNEIRYREIGKVNKKQHRHSWNHSTYERKKAEEKFYTIKPNSTFALDKCAKYYDRQMEEDAMKRQAHDGILKFFPEFYHGEINNHLDANIIVIENMLPAGFHTSNEAIFLDKERILLTLRTLGKFHASSYIAKYKNPNEFTKVVNMLRATGWTLPEYWDIYPNFLNKHLLRGVELLKNDTRYARQMVKFDAMLKNPKELFFKLMKVDEKIAVICHGDFCKNNILYKYETKDEEVEKSEPKSFNIDKKLKEKNTMLELEKLEKKKKIDDKVCVETYKMENQKIITEEEKFTNQFSVLKHDTQFGESHSIPQDVNTFSETQGFHRPKYDTIPCYKQNLDYLEKISVNRFYEDQRKENDTKQNSNNIKTKRKAFLDGILDTNSKTFLNTRELHSSIGVGVNKSNSPLLTKNAATHMKGLTYPKNQTISIEPQIAASKNTFITGLHCIENDGFEMTHHDSNEPFINENKKTQENISIPSTKIQLENSTKRIVRHDIEQKSSASKINENNPVISDRLQFLEEKYKQLEEIYNVNKCVLERKVVNMKIIEKLNEKKQILEEICKKIEKISQKQEMESKLYCSVNKLCQNIDNSETKRRLNSYLINHSTTYDQKKTDSIINEYPTQKQKIITQQNAKKTCNTQSVKKTSRISHTKHKIDQTTKSVDEKFDELYEQTFPNEIDCNYEEVFNDLSRRVSVSGDEKPSRPFTNGNESVELNSRCSTVSQISSMNTKLVSKINEKTPQSDGRNKPCSITAQSTTTQTNDTNSEYRTLSVKERRENLERSISLSNELKSFDKNQMKTKENKIITRSNSDINQIKFHSVLVSERNILLNDQTCDGASEKAAIIRDISKGLQTRPRSRIFTDSSWSIDECEEFPIHNNDVFGSTNYIQETNSNVTSKKYNEGDLTRSQSHVDLKSSKPRPVPMKRTISLVEDPIIAKTNYVTEKAEDANKENTGSNYNFDSLNRRPRGSFEKKMKFYLSSDEEINECQAKELPFKETQSYLSSSSRSIIDQRKANEQTFGYGQTVQTDNKLGKVFDKPKGNKSEADPNKVNMRTPICGSINIAQRVPVNSKMPTSHPNIVPEIIFFDLARMIYASPVIDLSFFLFLNVSHELRISCWDEFILTYHSSLRSSVPSEVPIPSMADLRKELKDKCIYGYFLCCFFLPWMMEEHPRQEVDQWIHHGGREGTEAIANILRFLIDRDLV
uniref:CHK kinase-like domain-containing protein n=1 Tax=Cacopsylla melanoneura TaxID=428564 RepID=A0A8D8LL41_9HEMI